MKRIEVVAAVIMREGRVFATQRGYGEWKDWWEFPGGKVEPGETHSEALRREIREELDTEVSVGKFLTTVEYDYPKFHLTMHCYLCTVLAGHLSLLEHEDARWLAVEQLYTVKWLPADVAVVRLLRSGAAGSRSSSNLDFSE
jgi:8-oxo-dGTP diphosphatase